MLIPVFVYVLAAYCENNSILTELNQATPGKPMTSNTRRSTARQPVSVERLVLNNAEEERNIRIHMYM